MLPVSPPRVVSTWLPLFSHRYCRTRRAGRLILGSPVRENADIRHAGAVTDAPTPSWVPVPDIAAALGLVVTRLHQSIRDRLLISVRQDDGVVRIPAEFVQDGEIVKGLTGTITLLTDGGYRDDEIVSWLFTEDESLPGAPIIALRENRGREVHRRAQAAAF